MTLRRGVSLIVALAAILYVGYTRTAAPSIVAPQARSDGSVSLITEPDDGMAPIISMIDAASSSVDIVMYEFQDQNVERALAQAEDRGVEVRVLLNGGYYGKKESAVNDQAYRFFSQNGIAVHWTPSYFALTHQKAVVIDGKAALIMTMNLTPQYYASSRDFAVVDSDPKDVAAIDSVFESDWQNAEAPAQAGDDLVWSPGSEQILLSLIQSATSTLDIYNEEMNDAKIEQALEAAAERGVSVHVDMTYSSEWKAAFTALQSAGAQVRTFARDAPLYIHAKMIVADGSNAFVGSENFSAGSLKNNRELGIIVSDSPVIGSLEKTFNSDWLNATPFKS